MYTVDLKHKSVVVAILFGLGVAHFAPASAADIDSRIQELNQNITSGVRKGAIKLGQAAELRQSLNDIRQAAASKRGQGGRLKPNDLAGLESRLNQQANIIRSYNQAGARKGVSKRAIGPAWVAGADGAQNPRKLKRQMKVQEKRQLHQFDQSMMQVKEQQQQEYEKQMLQKLGSQRPEILKNKQDLDKVRENTGAN